MADLHPSGKFISPELPPEILLIHILPRLPPKSVLRFHSVCKQWLSFLKTPTFSDLHRHHDSHKILVMSTREPYNFRTIDCEVPEDGLSTARSLPFEAKAENMTIITSLNGLVCVGIKKIKYDKVYSDLILWNPLTGEYKMLSRTNSDEKCYTCTGRAFGLYYSCSEDDYKLLCVTYYFDAYVYSLKSDSWRKVESTLVNNIQRVPYYFLECWQPGVVLNEKLYFMKRVKNGSLSPPSFSIITFDVKTEKFSDIATPSFGNQMTWCSKLMVVRGCINLCVTYNITNGNSRVPLRAIWRMDGDGDGDWKKVATYLSMPSFSKSQQPLHVMNNGNVLMHSKEKGYVYKVDLETHTKEVLCSYIGMDISSGGKYIETFVSLDRYTK